MNTKNFYGRQKIISIQISQGNQSDESNLSSSDDEENFVPVTHVANATFDSDSSELNEDVSEESSSDDTIADIHVNPDPPARKKLRQSKTNVQWKHCQTSNALNVPCNEEITEINIDQFSDPIDFFRHLFKDCILEFICDESNKYAIQVDPTKPLHLTKNELKQFIGILFMMSIVKMPSPRDYWAAETRYAKIADIMSRIRFEKINRFIYCNDNLEAPQPLTDVLYKVRSIITHLKTFLNYLSQKNSSVLISKLFRLKDVYA